MSLVAHGWPNTNTREGPAAVPSMLTLRSNTPRHSPCLMHGGSTRRFSSMLLAGCLTLLLACGLWAAAPASAATQTWDTPVFGGYSWVVPSGVTTATFDLSGASGGAAGGSIGGKGGE